MAKRKRKRREIRCALCNRRISRRVIEQGKHIYSPHTKSYYCGVADMERCAEIRKSFIVRGEA